MPRARKRIGHFSLIGAAALVGCSTPMQTTGPLSPVDDPTIRVERRAQAVQEVWDRSDRPNRQALIDLYWSRGTPVEIRSAILRTLASDDDARSTAKRMIEVSLPIEQNEPVIETACELAVEHGWTELAGPMARSLARKGQPATIADRPEARALRELFPGRSLEQVVFDQVVEPSNLATIQSGGDLDLADRTRLDAWELLGKLDATGRTRARLVGSLPISERTGLAGDLAAVEVELGVLPMTALEVDWTRTMRRDADWWQRASVAMTALDRQNTGPLQLRHVEPVRWASENDPALLGASRTELLAGLESRIAGRERITRTADRLGTGPNREGLADWADALTWGDLLALTIIERELDSTRVARDVFRYVDLDRADRSTEFGGLLADRGRGMNAELFVPRPSERLGDDAFVASPDLFAASARSLAHFHLQVQENEQRRYAGPSGGDVLFAARSGRNAVVFTAVGPGELNADFYTPRGEVVDLGVLTPTGWAGRR